jgi:hypothetical protein
VIEVVWLNQTVVSWCHRQVVVACAQEAAGIKLQLGREAFTNLVPITVAES